MRWVWCALFVVAACGSSSDGVDPENPNGPDASRIDGAVGGQPDSSSTSEVTEFSATGPASVSITTGSVAGVDCTLSYSLYTPSGGDSAPLVVLGHGFSRDQSNVGEIAEHVASFGARVATPSYCHSSAFDTDHEKNGQDAVILSAALRDGAAVIHAGHSAGGLAAVLASADDTATVALLGLDMVDASSLGAQAATQLSMPALGLVGEPGSCNDSGNGRPVFDSMSSSSGIYVVGATHCDFEAPSNSLCTSFCGGTDPARVTTVKALAAAFVAWQAGVDPTGEQWVTAGGSELSRLQSEGLVELLP